MNAPTTSTGPVDTAAVRTYLLDLQRRIGIGPAAPRGEQLRHAGFNIATLATVLGPRRRIGRVPAAHAWRCIHQHVHHVTAKPVRVERAHAVGVVLVFEHHNHTVTHHILHLPCHHGRVTKGRDHASRPMETRSSVK